MKIAVDDPFGVIQDREMPTLSLAVDSFQAERALRERLPRFFKEQEFELSAIRVTRYKPGRRCVIEYDLNIGLPEGGYEKLTLIGKVRAHRFGKSGLRLQSALWHAGFDDHSVDGISVPEPIGHIPRLQIWLQRKVPGQIATDFLTTPEGPGLLCKIAKAAHKLHKTGVTAEKSHTIEDELRILWEHLPKVAYSQPTWTSRIESLLKMTECLGGMLPPGETCGIHRDFYPDQVIFGGNRLYLIDFDLYCNGSPGLDIGNFIGHITEYSLRTYADPFALSHLEQTLEDSFVALSGESRRAEVRVYAALTVVRHIYLSTLFAERRAYTQILLEYSEQLLSGMTRKCARTLTDRL
ncbi:MAG: phosphotransferase family protein [Gammaproteobacteria bacterium]